MEQRYFTGTYEFLLVDGIKNVDWRNAHVMPPLRLIFTRGSVEI